MGYLSGLISNSFIKNVKGEVIFNPYDKWGKSYILTDKKVEEISSFLKFYYLIRHIIFIILLLLIKMYALLLFILEIPLYVILISKYLKGCPITSERIKTTFTAKLNNTAIKMGLGTSVILLVASFMMTSLAFVCMVLSKEIYHTLVGLTGCVLFGSSFVMNIYYIKYLLRKGKSRNT